MSGGLVFPSLSEFSTVSRDPHSSKLYVVNKAEVDVFLELFSFFDDPTDVGNLIAGSSAFSNTIPLLMETCWLVNLYSSESWYW